MAIPVLFDLETKDPDDILTLCLIADHPRVDLVAVTINPGTDEQVGVVAEVLQRLGREVPLGARNPHQTNPSVSAFHYDWLGSVTSRPAPHDAVELLLETLQRRPDTVLLTGAPLQTLRLALRRRPELVVRRWVGQGGFAGDNLVAPEHRLARFDGRLTCETYNLGHDPKGAALALQAPGFGVRQLVSKNVTHGVSWDPVFHQQMRVFADSRPGMQLACEAMGVYLEQHPEGKLLHDPLAAAAVLEPSLFGWAEVELYSEKGAWGSRPAPGSRTFISLTLDRERLLPVLVGS